MFESYFRKEINWGGKTLVLETGKIARQADGAVMARLGDTIVLCTAVGARSVKPGQVTLVSWVVWPGVRTVWACGARVRAQ